MAATPASPVVWFHSRFEVVSHVKLRYQARAMQWPWLYDTFKFSVERQDRRIVRALCCVHRGLYKWSAAHLGGEQHLCMKRPVFL